MDIPKYYREEDRQKILAFLKQHNFAALATFDGEKPIATHTQVESESSIRPAQWSACRRPRFVWLHRKQTIGWQI